MSDALSIAAVTHTLCHVLGDALAVALPDERAEVTAGRPGKDEVDEPTVFVHLYRVAPNAAQRNADLSTRSAKGELLQRPRAAIDLDFLLSFRGDESALVPQRMLGAIVAHLHAYPSLTQERIKRALTNAKSPLDTCNLADEGACVRLSPQDLSTDELAKLWATLPQTPYLLSIAYRAATILIDGAEAPAPPKPVRDLHIDARQREPLRADSEEAR